MSLPFEGPFGKSKEDKSVDVDQAVKKIKSVYTRYAEKYGSKLFNLKAFEERYRNALASRLNLNAFLHAEIMVIEELKKRVEGDKGRDPPRFAYSEIADKIVEKNLEKIKKYRSIDFHPDAEIETKHLLGASTDFYDKIWERTVKILKSLRLKDLSDFIAKIENDFAYYVIPFRGSYSRAVDDYTLVLARKSARDSEKAAVNFIRYGGILLNNCLKAITDGINALEGLIEGEGAAMDGPGPQTREPRRTLRELVRCKDILLRLIEDFRLSEIRGY